MNLAKDGKELINNLNIASIKILINIIEKSQENNSSDSYAKKTIIFLPNQ